MLEIKVEIVPFGVEEDRRLLDKIQIINTGNHEDSPHRGEYVCHHSDGSFIIPDHNRTDGYWSLIKKCLDEYLS